MRKCQKCGVIYDESDMYELSVHMHFEKPIIGSKQDSEKKLEPALREHIQSVGGECLKFVSPGTRGVPDRLILMPNRVDFVELKTLGRTLDPLQEWWEARIKELGLNHYTIDNQKSLHAYLDTL